MAEIVENPFRTLGCYTYNPPQNVSVVCFLHKSNKQTQTNKKVLFRIFRKTNQKRLRLSCIGDSLSMGASKDLLDFRVKCTQA